jgi:hypothetical protein
MINAKLAKQVEKQNSEERLFKLLESIDWKLWEMYNMMKDNVPNKPKLEKNTVKANKTEV